MTAAQVLADLRGRGVILWAAGDQLQIRAPAGTLTPALRKEMAALKFELLGLVPDRPPEAAPATARSQPSGYTVAAPDPSAYPNSPEVPTGAQVFELPDGGYRLVLPEPDPPWADPRPDLAGDHQRWERLLEQAFYRDYQNPAGAFGILFGIRCCGAQLVEQAGGAWRIVCGEMREGEWADARTRWLLPIQEVIRGLLAAAAARRPEQ